MSHETAPGYEMAESTQQSSYIKLSGDEVTPNAKESRRGTWPKFRDSLRLLRLQFLNLILGRFTSWNSDTECRKVAMYHSRRIAASHILLHFLPLGGATILLVLQWTKYWIGIDTNISTFLQFVAKLHELIMQASLVEIFVCIIRTQLVNGYVPLGALSAATQPTQLSYLWSLEFVSIFTSSAVRGWRRTLFLLAIPFLLVLTSLVGPSSAILMIPRPDTPHVIQDVIMYILRSNQDLYPSSLSGADGLDLDLQYYNLTSWGAKSQEAHQSDDAVGWNREMVVMRPLGECADRRILRSYNKITKDTGIANATLPTCFTAYSIDYSNESNGFNYTGRGKWATSVTTMHPVVSTQCWTPSNEHHTGLDSDVPYLHDNGMSRGVLFDVRTLLNKVSNFSGVGSAASRAMDNSAGQTSVYFPPVWTASPEPGSHSLIGVFPYWLRITQKEEPPPSLSWVMTKVDAETIEQRLFFMACTIRAYWNTGEIQSIETLGSSDTQTSALAMTEAHDTRPITLDVANINAMQGPEFPRDLYDIYYYPETALSEISAIAISATPSSDTYLVKQMPPNRDKTSTVPFRFTTILYGYGYATRSTSIILALSVMLTYCIVTLIYIFYILITGSSSTAWHSAIELVTLALQSRKPDHLGHIGVGLDSIQTFKEGVGVRVNEDSELELVFAHDRDLDKRKLRRIERGKEY